MSRTRLILLCLMATAAVSMVASASASATIEFWQCKKVPSGKFLTHQCNSTGAGPEWETKQLAGTETMGVSGTSGVSKLEGKILSISVVIECKKDVFTGTLEKHGEDKGKVEFKECTQTGLGAACTVHEPIVFNFTSQLIGSQPNPEIEFKPASGATLFVLIEIVGSTCASKGKYEVTGTQTCNIPNAQASGTEHEFECTPAGSTNLLLGGKAAKFTSTEKLHEEKLWAWGIDP